MPIFQQNHGLTPFAKMQFFRLCYSLYNFYSLESLVSYVDHNQTIYIGLLKRKTTLEEMFMEEQFLRDSNTSRANGLQTKPKDSNDVVPFLATYITQHFHAFLISYANILTCYSTLF